MMPLRSICVHFIFMMIVINFLYICSNGGASCPDVKNPKKKPATGAG